MAKKIKAEVKKPILQQPHPVRYSVLNEDLDHLPVAEYYKKLVSKLQKDLKRGGEAQLRELISQCPEDLRVAGFIYAVAVEDYEKVEDEFNALMGEWLIKARAGIAALKKDKQWEGAAYTQDIERWIASEIPQHKEAKAVLRKSKTIRDSARRLYEAYEKRLGSLQSYAKLIQKRQGLSVEQKHGSNS